MSLRIVHKWLIGLAIIFLPIFNSVGSAGVLGALGRSASTYPLLLGVLLWGGSVLLHRERIYYPKTKSVFFLLSFFIIAVFSGIFNLYDLSIARHQGFSGIGRFLIQLGALFFYVLIAFYVYNFFRREEGTGGLFFARMIGFSFLLAGAYSFCELGSFMNITFFSDILHFVDALFRPDNDYLYGLHIRSLTKEASMFAMYGALILPWVLSYLFQRKGMMWNVLIVAYFILLMGLSFSRTAYVVFFIQILIFFFLHHKEFLYPNKYRFLPVLYVCIILVFLLIAIYFLNEELFSKIDIEIILGSLMNDDMENPYSHSTVARFSSQIAALYMFFDHPIFGVGLGGFGFYASQYYPSWAGDNIEIIQQSANIVGGSWPLAHGLYARILAEMGGIGLLFWVLLWGRSLLYIFSIHKYPSETHVQYRKNIGISIIGVLLIGFTGDSLTWASYWIYLGLLWAIEVEGVPYIDSERKKLYEYHHTE